jgi:hypothetical protein
MLAHRRLVLLTFLGAITASGCASVDSGQFDKIYQPAKACPGTGPILQQSPDSKGNTNPKFSDCAKIVVKSAIDYCVDQALNANIVDHLWAHLAQGGLVASAIATGAASAGGLTGAPLIGVGLGTLVLTQGSTGILKILPSAPYQVNIQNMITSATQYAALNPGVSDDTAYRRLWNATGSACPPDVFKAATPIPTEGTAPTPIAPPAPLPAPPAQPTA